VPPSRKPVLEIDGSAFDDLEGFYDEVSRKLIPGAEWGRNLDAFNDILRGGFGTPDGGFVLRWKNSGLSRLRLGWDEQIRSIERGLSRCDPTGIAPLQARLEAARRHEGETVFDDLVAIIRVHGTGGHESADGVELELA
jgi:RNAse (barnase) inhibitor barstar